MKLEPDLYNQNPMPRREMYVNLAKAAVIMFCSLALIYFGSDRHFGYLIKYSLVVIPVSLAGVIWCGVILERIISGVFDKRFHE